MLRVRELNVAYDGIHTLWNVSLRIEKNEIVALLGPNGAGKSTLLKTILGMVRLVSGSITFKDERIDGLPPSRIVDMGISYVPEGRGIFPHMTVRENLELGAMSKRSKASMERNQRWCFEIFPILKEREKQMAGTMSGGEMQMLAIARGLMSDPTLLMVDEASLGLGPILVMKIFEVLKEINKRGVTLFLVEQNVAQALAISHRAYVLENGRIVLEERARNLMNHEHIKRAYLGV